ncbi:MAG: phosphoglycerate kinase, partial [Comamonadaceae bacterium]
MTLWLVRHAVTLAAPGTCYGRLDVAAEPSSTGIAAQALAAALPRGVKVLSSPASRCRLLAAELARHRPDLAAAASDDRLQEMDFGAWEGQAWSAIGEAALTRWTDDFAGHAPGGGESVQALLDRVASALHEARGQERPTVW